MPEPEELAYRRWLGWKHSTAPNHYELLGVPSEVADPDQISAAAQRRLAQLRQAQPTGDAEAAQLKRLLYEVTRARQCLVDPQLRARYDRSLAAPALEPLDLALCPDLPLEPLRAPVAIGGHLPPRQVLSRSRALGKLSAGWWAGAAGSGLLLLTGGLIYLTRDADAIPVAQADAPSREEASADNAPPPPTPPRPSNAPQPQPNEAPLPTPEPALPAQSLPSGPPPAPFASLPAETELPRRVLSQTLGVEAAGSRRLGPVALAGRKLSVALDCSACDLPGSYAFVVEPHPQNAEQWLVRLAPRPAENNPASAEAADSSLAVLPASLAPVALLTAADGQLAFQWNAENTEPRAEQLRNAVLHLRAGEMSHALRLRRVRRVPPWTVDLASEAHRIGLDLPHPPPREQLFLEITALDGFDLQLAYVVADRKFGVGEVAEIPIHATPEASLNLSLVQQDEGWEITIFSHYQIGRRATDLHAEQVRTTLLGLNRTLQENAAEMRAAQAAVETIGLRLRYLQGLPAPTGISREIQMAARLQEARNLQAQLKKALSTIRRFENSLPRTQLALQQMTSLAAACTALHQHARVHYRVVADTPAGERELSIAGP